MALALHLTWTHPNRGCIRVKPRWQLQIFTIQTSPLSLFLCLCPAPFIPLCDSENCVVGDRACAIGEVPVTGSKGLAGEVRFS
ncbi:unnamed protein product [Prunus armeniaca]|uniref:Uncharacterized protein n=1 Tax=Prunus armeniaca TaxID=36596 RepID=A0A6J5TCW5_PRUAR|nr:unnamed protein product [Prunus armeniaca]